MRKVHRYQGIKHLFTNTVALTLASMIAVSSMNFFGIGAVDDGSFENTPTEEAGSSSSEAGLVIEFDGTTADEGIMDSYYIENDQTSFQVPENKFIREGYDFNGWSTTIDNRSVTELQVDEEGEHLVTVEKAVYLPVDLDAVDYPSLTFDYDFNQDDEITEDETFSLDECIKEEKLVLYPQWKKTVRAEDEQETGDPDGSEDQKSSEITSAFLENARLIELTEEDFITLDEMEELTSLNQFEEDAQTNETSESPEAGSEEPETEQLPGEDIPAAEEPAAVLDDVRVSWLKDSEIYDETNWEITLSDDNQFYVRARADLTVRSSAPIQPGTLRLRVPKQIFMDRSENLIGRMSLAVPEAPDESATFSYTETEDEYILSNVVKLPETSSMFFEFTIDGLTPHLIKSKETGYMSEPFKVTAELETEEGDLIQNASEGITAQVITDETLVNAGLYSQQCNSSLPETWPDEIRNRMTKTGLNPENYFYVDWYASAKIAGNQTFRMDISADPSVLYETSEDQEPIVLGIQYNGEVTAAQEGQTEFTLADEIYYSEGTRFYTRFYVAYPIPELDKGMTLNVQNTVTYTLTAADNEKVTVKSATAKDALVYELYTDPGGSMNIFKDGVGGDSTESSWIKNGYYHPSVGHYSFGFNDLMKQRNTSFNFNIRTMAFGFTWTLKDGGDPKNLQDYGETPYIMRTSDSAAYLDEESSSPGSEESKLKDGEYRFKSIYVSRPIIYQYKKADYSQSGYRMTNGMIQADYTNDGKLKHGTVKAGEYGFLVDSDPTNIPDLKVYVRLAGKQDFELAATVRFNGSASEANEVLCKVEGYTVAFNESVNVSSFYTEAKTAIGGFDWNIRPEIELMGNTERISQLVQSKLAGSDIPSTTIGNLSYGEMFDSQGTLINRTQDKYAYDCAESAAQYVSLTKKVTKNTAGDNSTSGYARIGYQIDAKIETNLTSNSAYNRALAEDVFSQPSKGIFYDLLPLGAVPDLDSFSVRNGDQITDLRVYENFNQSGRTLVKVSVEHSPKPVYQSAYNSIVKKSGYADIPSLSFEVIYTSFAKMEFSKDLYNTAAYIPDCPLGTVPGYKTEESGYFNGEEPDNFSTEQAFSVYSKSEQAHEAKEAMKSALQKEANPAFLLASVHADVDKLDAFGVSGLTKAVSANGSGIFQNADTVFENGTYTYRLGIFNLDGGSASNIILYDSLESADSDSGTGVRQWKGTFRSVDLSSLDRLGIASKIYISEKEDLNLENAEERNLQNTEIWKLTEDPNSLGKEEKAKIRAVAIDASTAKNGQPFTLEKDKPLATYIKMAAPSLQSVKTQYESESTEENDETFQYQAVNTCHVLAKTNKQNEVKLLATTPTRVTLSPLDIIVQKQWYDNGDQDGLRPDKLKVQLVYRKVNGETVDAALDPVILWAENNWKAEMNGITPADEDGYPYTLTFRETGYFEPEEQENPEETADQETEQPAETAEEYRELTDYNLQISRRTDTDNREIYTLRNTHTPYTVDLSGTKEWDDDGQSDKRPGTIAISLLANGTYSRRTTTSAEKGWKYSFENLPKNSRGKEIAYTVQEDYVPGYTSQVDGTDIVNTYDPFGNLEIAVNVQKLTPAARKNSAFTMTLTLTDQDGTPVGDEYSYTVWEKNADGEYLPTGTKGKISTGSPVVMEADQKIVIENISSETNWRIDNEYQEWFDFISDSGRTGTIRAGRSHQSTFDYIYKAQGSVYFSASKVIEGRRSLVPYQFQFRLTDDRGEVIRTVSNDRNPAGKNINFGAVRFTLDQYLEKGQVNNLESADFEYQIEEIDRGWAGYTFDHRKYQAIAHLVDDGQGTLVATAEYPLPAAGSSEDGQQEGSYVEETGIPQFENRYTASGSVIIRSWKEVIGGDLFDGEFKFNLLNDKGEEIQTAANDENGVIDFKLDYHQDQVGQKFEYYVEEDQSDPDPDYIYDTDLMKYSVVIEDNENGTLYCDLTFEGRYKREAGEFVKIEDPENKEQEEELPVFKNRLSDGSLTIRKVVMDEDLVGEEFEFEVELTDPEGNPIEKELPSTPRAEKPFGVTIDLFTEENTQDFYQLYYFNQFGDRTKLSPYYIGGFIIYSVSENGERKELGRLKRNVVDQDMATEMQADKLPVYDSTKGGSYFVKADYDYQSVYTDYGFSSDEPVDQLIAVPFDVGSYQNRKSINGNLTLLQSIEQPLETQDSSQPATIRSGLEADSAAMAKATESLSSGFKINRIGVFSDLYKDITNLVIPLTYDKESNYYTGSHRFSLIDVPYGRIEGKTLILDTIPLNDLPELENTNKQAAPVSIIPYRSVGIVMEGAGHYYPWENSATIDTITVTRKMPLYDASYLFNGMTSLTAVDLSKTDLSYCRYFVATFQGCSGLTNVNFGESAPDALDYSNMFKDCTALETMDLSQLKAENGSSYTSMFEGCKNLQQIIRFGSNTVLNMRGNSLSLENMFKNCDSLTDTGISLISISAPRLTASIKETVPKISLGSMFENCVALKEVPQFTGDENEWNLNLNSAFKGCSSIKSIDIKGINVRKKSNIRDVDVNPILGVLQPQGLNIGVRSAENDFTSAFEDCASLTDVAMPPFASSYATMSKMFKNCQSLESLTLDLVDPESGAQQSGSSLSRSVSPSSGIHINTGEQRAYDSAFEGCIKLKNLDLNSFILCSGKATLGSFLKDCQSLEEIDLSFMDTSKVTNMDSMFAGCSSLRKIYAGPDQFNLSSIPQLTLTGERPADAEMFLNCTSIQGGNGTRYDAEKIRSSMARIDSESTPGYFTLSPRFDNQVITSGSSDLSEEKPDADQEREGTGRSATVLRTLSSQGLTTAGRAEESTAADRSEIIADLANEEPGSEENTRAERYAYIDGEVLYFTNTEFTPLESVVGKKIFKDIENEEVRPDWINETITAVCFLTDVSPVSTQNWFSISGLTSIQNLDKLNTKNVINMDYMFGVVDNCLAPELNELDLSSFSFANVKSMNGMFMNAQQLEKINFGDAVIPDGVLANELFKNASSLKRIITKQKELKIAAYMWEYPWPTAYSLFENCSKLEDSGFKTITITIDDANDISYGENILEISRIFTDCDSLTFDSLPELRIIAQEDIAVTLESIYANCYNLTNFLPGKLSVDGACEVNLNSLFTADGETNQFLKMIVMPKIENIKNIDQLFYQCYGLENVDVSQLDLALVESARELFYYCPSLKIVDLSNLSGPLGMDISDMFKDCDNLESVDLSGLPPRNPGEEAIDLFQQCHVLKEIKLNDYKNGMSESPVLVPDNVQEDSYYTGLWQNSEQNVAMTAYELNKSTTNGGGTWKWQRKDIDWYISFNSNGGSGSMQDYVGNTVDRKLVFPENRFYRFNYRFAGWSENKDANPESDQLYQPGAEIVPEIQDGQTKTYYAIWKESDNNHSFVNGKTTVILHGNESVTFDLPGGTHYRVTEKSKPGWVLVSATDDEGLISPNRNTVAKFVNDYDPEAAVLELKGEKTVDEVKENLESFNFKVRSENEIVATGTNGRDGQIIFTPIKLDRSGDYEFYVSETRQMLGEEQRYIYDSTTYRVEVHVIRGETGALEIPEDGIAYYAVNSNPMMGEDTEESVEEIVFENFTYQETEPQLTICPKIENCYGEQVEGKELPETIKDSAFSFRVDFGNGESRTVNGLKHLQESDVLSGTGGYTIVPISVPEGFKLLSTKDELKGEDILGTEPVVKYIRFEYSASGATMIETEKKLNGALLQKDQFQFRMKLKTLDGSEVLSSVEKTARNTADGKVLFDLEYTKPGKYVYSLREVDDTETDSSISYDNSEKTVRVNVVDQGGGRLKAQVEPIQTDSEPNSFTNSVKPGNLRITKTVQSSGNTRPTGQIFTFDVTLTNENGMVLDGEYDYQTGRMDDSSAPVAEKLKISDGKGILELKDGEFAEILNIPGNTEYLIEERNSESFTSSSENASGAIQPGQTVTAAFVNTWTATVQFSPKAAKTLVSGTLKADQFSFILVDQTAGSSETQTNTESGTVEFSTRTYTAEDVGRTFIYRISELNDGQMNIEYDSNTYELTVTVKTDDQTGMLKLEKSCVRIDEEGKRTETDPDDIQFINHQSYYLFETGQGGIAAGVAAGAVLIGLSSIELLKRRRKSKDID